MIALDNGDTLHGTYPAVHSKGEAFVPLLNSLALDGMTVHWEFAFGPAHLRALAARISYPILAINCYEKESGRLAFPPARVIERGGLKVGIVGIAATIVDKGMPPAFSEGVRFTLGRDELHSTPRAPRLHASKMVASPTQDAPGASKLIGNAREEPATRREAK